MSATTPSPQKLLAGSIEYYDANAKAFCQETANLDLSQAYARFLPHLPKGGDILDAGCGSGRDSLHFSRRGYQVQAFDASPEMVRLAKQHTGLPVECLAFQDLDRQQCFDGVFASASLLHVPRQEFPLVLRLLGRALRPGGVIYASLKHGTRQWFKQGLYYSAYDESAIESIFQAQTQLQLSQCWATPDLRPGREKESWLHFLARRR